GAKTTVLVDDRGNSTLVIDALGNVLRTRYDANGQPVNVSYPGGTADSFVYDSQGYLKSQTDPLGNTTQYTVDPEFGDLTRTQSASGALTTYNYTSLGNLASVFQADGTSTLYQYNAQGQVTSSTDALGRTTTYVYDSAGRLTHIGFPDGTFQDNTF